MSESNLSSLSNSSSENGKSSENGEGFENYNDYDVSDKKIYTIDDFIKVIYSGCKFIEKLPSLINETIINIDSEDNFITFNNTLNKTMQGKIKTIDELNGEDEQYSSKTDNIYTLYQCLKRSIQSNEKDVTIATQTLNGVCKKYYVIKNGDFNNFMDSLYNYLNSNWKKEYMEINLKQKVLQKRRETEQKCDPSLYHRFRPWGGRKLKSKKRVRKSRKSRKSRK
jgi:hypothetical protein